MTTRPNSRPPVPTFAHYLRQIGYQTAVSGKMHFVGADQLHGFEHRLTTDVYPGGFDWTPDWERPLENRLPWYHQPDSIRMAGPVKASMQIDFDNEVCFQAVRKIYDYPRSQKTNGRSSSWPPSPTPTTPSTPPNPTGTSTTTMRSTCPSVGRIPNDQLDPHSYRLRQMYGVLDDDLITDEMIRNSRHAYYGMISYIDAKVGELIEALKDTDQYDNTIIHLHL